MTEEKALYAFEPVSNLIIGDHILIKEFPCKIIEVASSKTGKHGVAKIWILGKDIFTDTKYGNIYVRTELVKVPIISKTMYIPTHFEEYKTAHSELTKLVIVSEDKSETSSITFNETETDQENKKFIAKYIDIKNCKILVLESMNKKRIVQVTATEKIVQPTESK